MADKSKMLADRESGMKYVDIAKKHGVSYQYAARVLSGYNPKHFSFVREDACIYPNLRKWMNDNMVSRSELLRRMNYAVVGGNVEKLSDIMKGKVNPKKNWIDALIAVTGMKYERLFAEGSGKNGK
jgi:hypothetical protein